MANYTIIEVIQAWERAGEEADALFGSGEPSEAELAIIFNAQLDFTAKIAKLQLLRGETVNPKSFDNRLTTGDYLHARALGVELEDEMERARR